MSLMLMIRSSDVPRETIFYSNTRDSILTVLRSVLTWDADTICPMHGIHHYYLMCRYWQRHILH